MKLIKSTASDIPELQQLCTEAYIGNFADHWKDQNGLDLYLKEQFSHNQLLADVTSLDVDYFVIQSNMNSVGFIKIKYHQSIGSYSSAQASELEKIYMRPNQKGKGFGKWALTELNDICKSLKKEIIFLCVLDTNYNSIKFYEKIGFRFHSATLLQEPNFKEELKGMNRMIREL